MASALLIFRVSSVWVTLSLQLMLSATADGQGGEPCSPVPCGNVSISFPFGIIPEQAMETSCGETGFQVRCSNNTPYLGYTPKHWFQIRDIFYDNASLLIADVHKLGGFNNSAGSDGCRIPTNNTPAHLGLPLSISPVNHNLIFYNCTKAPAPAAGEGLVETRCRTNKFVRVGGRYGNEYSSSSYGSYFVESCDAAVVPVLGGSGRTNASGYEELISDGFLVTWQPLSPPSAGGGRTVRQHGRSPAPGARGPQPQAPAAPTAAAREAPGPAARGPRRGGAGGPGVAVREARDDAAAPA